MYVALSRFVFTALLLPLPLAASGLPPWQFGMSKAQVQSFGEYGPYKEFRNGDIETVGGLFDGRKENIQFFFNDGGLRRIGVYMYEGQDAKEASRVWQRAYESLRRAYGEIEMPWLKIESTKKILPTPEILAIAAGATTDATGKTQMAPVKQPPDMFVFCSFTRHNVQGATFYYVVINLDRRP